MKNLQLNNKWVLVTGASSGLGQEMARQLANVHKANLIIAARRADKLNALKAELEQDAGIKVKVIIADLSIPEEADRVIAESIADNNLYAAILNAGVTYFGRHTELAWDNFESILKTNVIGVVRMTNSLVKYFEQPGTQGGLMLVSSMAGFFPVPYQAAYSATKAFITAFGNALHNELTNPDFSITVFAPGGIATEMTDNSKFNELKGWLMPVSVASEEAIHALVTRKYNYVPGLLNRLGNVFMNFLPSKFISGKMSKVYLKSLNKAQKGS
ncbi:MULTISPECIES: SDR family NAD(P)-dependent oxidoreductase [unclassified Mucilaginibacter]|uniref:SDR family NAD(P)-dependent oxidoreductase n=1 Tax=unclassified Mucilaginibacter TaxID=2617802 RepID=UPI002AC9CD18|nr:MULTISPECIES: SDR family NAD(P)-dependent oxidoreductase [unclassified Mucilaginibacter]MEB0262980.1 SDR family NAD(P)-dependent oxidoreductase [Mucilaginibacter sp. 10I4]MEB0280284.1 SDR family NAD(P)-dependent oxidoreductase [Mucilaginibacter sp. 10B2]MEB0300229.1 SDR family NAD(P)-dependent oxidoreductase [Mucilaginibacter sp. 5C4]WPX25587.1 SDR family NAD(P)-dependent oxidoreductase [Mucilaginibacter sp. 5C4]